MTTIGHVFIPLNRDHDGMLPSGSDHALEVAVPSRYVTV